MNPKPAASPLSLTPGDIYYILFRHKWIVIGVSILAIAAAAIFRSRCNVYYNSEAKIMIKYVHENKVPDQIGPDALTGDVKGENAVASEMEIINSMDLAFTVADVLTPARILAKTNEGTNRITAAQMIRGNFNAVANNSDVLNLYFNYPNPEMVQPILTQIIEAYLKKHHEIHQGSGSVDFLTKCRDGVQTRITEMDERMQNLKRVTGIRTSDIIDSERMSGELESKIMTEKMEADVEFAQRNQQIKDMIASLPKPAKTNAVTTNAVPLTPEKITEYQRVSQQLARMQDQKEELLLNFTDEAPAVKNKQAQIDRYEHLKKELEQKYPALTEVRVTTGPAGPDPRERIRDAMIQNEALAMRIKTLTNQLADVQSHTATMNQYEGQIFQVQREKDIAEEEFSFYSRKLHEAKVNDEIGSGTNISVVEEPTPPGRDLSKFNKMVMGIFFGGLGLAFALPFVIELFLDRTLKRPLDVQARIKLPFFISIPLVDDKKNGKARRLKKGGQTALLANGDGSTNGNGNGNQNEALALWENRHFLQPFYETLRDRLVTYFEMINLTHKPKLVAVTSCGDGAGVTTTAAGLASSLSETGDGNVLLVNMNGRDGEAHHFYKGELTRGLDEVLENGAQKSVSIKGNLYVAKEQQDDDRLPRVLPKRFTHLLPKMKASDFDYIIFDMPPVSQISATPRLARFMDMVLLVIESGKTDRDVATRAAAMLAETKTNVGIVLNKNQTYGPRRLHHDL